MLLTINTVLDHRADYKSTTVKYRCSINSWSATIK